ncbi:MAG: 4-alpha-glucanotransferase [Chlamydiales bacterium]|nr:4-alpha-glucanotransferase [Chlamydiales bacterium]
MDLKTSNHWHSIGKTSHHGIALSLSSLRSQKSCGIGEFYDLLPLIDWCSQLGFNCIQLLPLTDSGSDTSPYNGLSSCALDPMYLSLHALADVNGGELTDSFKLLTNSSRLAIKEVKQKKLAWLRQYFQSHFSVFSSAAEYSSFITNHTWLMPYAFFKTCKEHYKDAHWKNWPKEANRQISQEEINFHLFTQYLCYIQLKAVKKHAESRQCFLKGDLPLLLSPDSADVWANPSLFDRTLSVGAPPDYYNRQGQKWGFPFPNWEAIEQTNFSWWKERLQTAEEFFHLYRIDHVVGLFRLWVMPIHAPPREGYFLPQDPSLWEAQGKKLLETLLKLSPLLPIAEDLGTIPKEVPKVLKELEICGTKVIRWERAWEKDQAYIPYSLYEPFSMTTVSTHDCPTLSGWWEEYPEEAKAFAKFKNWTYEPKLSPRQIQEILYDAHHTPSYFHINLLQEYLALFPELSRSNPREERINIPGRVLDSNWTYRFKPFLEDIVQHGQLMEIMRSYTKTT